MTLISKEAVQEMLAGERTARNDDIIALNKQLREVSRERDEWRNRLYADINRNTAAFHKAAETAQRLAEVERELADAKDRLRDLTVAAELSALRAENRLLHSRLRESDRAHGRLRQATPEELVDALTTVVDEMHDQGWSR